MWRFGRPAGLVVPTLKLWQVSAIVARSGSDGTQVPIDVGSSGRGAAWLARCNGVAEVGGSNPLAPTISITRKRILAWCPPACSMGPHLRLVCGQAFAVLAGLLPHWSIRAGTRLR